MTPADAKADALRAAVAGRDPNKLIFKPHNKTGPSLTRPPVRFEKGDPTEACRFFCLCIVLRGAGA